MKPGGESCFSDFMMVGTIIVRGQEYKMDFWRRNLHIHLGDATTLKQVQAWRVRSKVYLYNIL